ANEESVLFCKNLAVKVIDALSHWLKNLLHHRARFFGYIGNPQPSRRGLLVRLHPVVFIMQQSYLDTYALKEERAGTFE
ncbi:MAG: hypothetical protein LUQ06_05700, partial [Methylococcaceae bacterium]|nr:hypothetical protein [Methylococcaceae bacterium]